MSSGERERSPVTSASPATNTAPDVAPAVENAATTEPSADAATLPASATSRSPEVRAATPASDFVLEYRYELSLPAQNFVRRLERQQWLDPIPDYANEYSKEPSGYGLQERRYGSYPGVVAARLDHPSMAQHFDAQNVKLQVSGQPVSRLASEAPYSLDLEKDRWRAIEHARKNSSLYGFSSGHEDASHPMQLVRSSEISSERALGGRAIDYQTLDSQGNISSHLKRGDAFPQDVRGRESFDRMSRGLQDPNLYCSVCAYAFSTPYQKEVHFQSHVKCEEEQCPFEAIESKVKEHMLSEHGKHFRNLLRSSGGNLREVQGARMSGIQREELESADRNRYSGFPESREGQREGFLTPVAVPSQDARNEMELTGRKSRDKWNSRMANSSARFKLEMYVNSRVLILADTCCCLIFLNLYYIEQVEFLENRQWTELVYPPGFSTYIHE